MKKTIVIMLAMAVITGGIVSSCAFSKKAYKSASDAVSNVNVFPYTEDIKLGKQVKDEISSKPDEFPVLSRSQNREIYAYLEDLKKKIVNTGELRYAEDYPWVLTIIDDDKTLNAFATPGGYIYIYTGLIKFLESEDELIGVLGHEMAHADRRHSTRQLTKSLGLSMLLDAVLGKQDAVEQIVGSLVGLKFSRSHESEADEYSVKYLCKTSYNSDGAAGFFQKLKDQPTPPQFLSTHPNPENRIEKMKELEQELNCSGTTTNKQKYEQIKKLL
ncbi:M48 family metallopeptidase [Saprospiraceae bacterium]|nr:M48 family metallopeptidase [Saprospiraceae bacterium]